MRVQNQLVCVALAVASIAAAQQDPPGRVGRLDYMNGAVSFQPAGVDDWEPANPNRPLITGDQLWVDQGARAELQVGSATVWLNSGTAFQFLNLDDQNVQIRLAQGSAEVRVRYLDENQTFEIDTPNVAFSVLRPGLYRVDANPDSQTTTLTVRSGQAEATGGGQAFPLRPRDSARVVGDAQISYNISPEPAPDWFDSWADERDRREEQSASARYCSPYMVGYQDLDNAGRWEPNSDYGQVWYPQAVAADWAPYRFGHWAWIEPWGWTWVDDAPWGFAPFHYGRWAFIGSRWGWVPGPVAVRPVYAPALVAFVGGAGFGISIGIGEGIGWFPLGPREVYVPAYPVSVAYVQRVNVTNTIVNNTTVVNIYNNRTTVNQITYVNQTAPNAITAVSRETFVSARPVAAAAVVVRPNMIQRTQIQVVQTAAFVPTHQSVVGRPLPGVAPRPPATVVTRAVVTRTAPPPPPVPFAQRQQALQQQPGRPLAPAQVQQIRAQLPAAPKPYVRPAAPVPAGRPTQPQPTPPPQPQYQRPTPPVQSERQYERPQQTPPPQQQNQRPTPPAQSERQYERPAQVPQQPAQRQYERPASPPPQERHNEHPASPPSQERRAEPKPENAPKERPKEERPKEEKKEEKKEDHDHR